MEMNIDDKTLCDVTGLSYSVVKSGFDEWAKMTKQPE
jgi:hypothetical protein